MFEGYLNNSSALLQAIGAFGAGLLTLLTPCVYPLIPITLSVCGARAAQTRKEAFLSSLSYCAGICASYTLIGFVTIKSGALFGSFLSVPAVRYVMSALLIALALHSVEVISFGALNKLQTWASRFSAKGYWGTFFMGALSGFVAAPCVGPVLVLILTVAASVENQSFGIFLLFLYSVGMSLPFLLLGTFASLLTKLPKAGNWLNVIKFITAGALLLVVGFLNRDAFQFLNILNAMPLSLFGLFILALYLGRLSYQRDLKTLKCFSIFIFFCALFPLLFGAPDLPTANTSLTQQKWGTSIEEALNNNLEKKPLMIDFYADWCAACVEFDHKTFPTLEVQTALRHFHPVRVDFTNVDERSDELSKKYSIAGLPSIIFLNSKGEELRDLRVTGFLDSKQFADHLQKIMDAVSKDPPENSNK